MKLYGDYSDHPGHSATNCPLRRTVTAAFGSSSQNGYGCYYTGGHCTPTEDCSSLVKQCEREAKEESKVFIKLYPQNTN